MWADNHCNGYVSKLDSALYLSKVLCVDSASSSSSDFDPLVRAILFFVVLVPFILWRAMMQVHCPSASHEAFDTPLPSLLWACTWGPWAVATMTDLCSPFISWGLLWMQHYSALHRQGQHLRPLWYGTECRKPHRARHMFMIHPGSTNTEDQQNEYLHFSFR